MAAPKGADSHWGLSLLQHPTDVLEPNPALLQAFIGSLSVQEGMKRST